MRLYNTYNAVTAPVYIPAQVWLNLETAELTLGAFAPARVFNLGGCLYEFIGDL